jgi:hypothetical protein
VGTVTPGTTGRIRLEGIEMTAAAERITAWFSIGG